MSIITTDPTTNKLLVIPKRFVALSYHGQRHQRHRKIGPYLFLLPAFLFLFVFLCYPIGTMLLFSFRRADITGLLSNHLPFIGFANYRAVLNDPAFWFSAEVSFLFTCGSLIFQFGIGFLLALLFNKRFPGANGMRGLILVAWMLPYVVSGTIFKWMFQSDVGIINVILQDLGLISHPILWLSDPSVALWAVMIANIWIGIPLNMSLLFAGLQTIPTPLYEAARVDGANDWQRFRAITLPLMRSTSLTVLFIGLISTLNVFDLVYIMTSGGPVNATELLPMYAYRIAFEQFDLGAGSAVAALMFLALLLLGILYLHLVRREEVNR